MHLSLSTTSFIQIHPSPPTPIGHHLEQSHTITSTPNTPPSNPQPMPTTTTYQVAPNDTVHPMSPIHGFLLPLCLFLPPLSPLLWHFTPQQQIIFPNLGHSTFITSLSLLQCLQQYLPFFPYILPLAQATYASQNYTFYPLVDSNHLTSCSK